MYFLFICTGSVYFKIAKEDLDRRKKTHVFNCIEKLNLILPLFRLLQDPKLRQLVNIGSSADSLEEKTVTLVFGTDYVNLTFINFCCTKKEVAKVSSFFFRRAFETLLMFYPSECHKFTINKSRSQLPRITHFTRGGNLLRANSSKGTAEMYSLVVGKVFIRGNNAFVRQVLIIMSAIYGLVVNISRIVN